MVLTLLSDEPTFARQIRPVTGLDSCLFYTRKPWMHGSFPCYSFRERAATGGESGSISNTLYSAISNHLQESVDTKFLHLRWVPHQLMEVSRSVWMETCRESLAILEAREKRPFRGFVAGDGRGVTLECYHLTKRSISRDQVRQKSNNKSVHNSQC
jgi:hypothetical protein